MSLLLLAAVQVCTTFLGIYLAYQFGRKTPEETIKSLVRPFLKARVYSPYKRARLRAAEKALTE